MGAPIPFRRKPRSRLPAAWQPFLRRRGLSAAQVRIMIWTGLLAGLLAFQVSRYWSLAQSAPDLAAAATPALPADPYAEAARSRAILEAQEGAPPAAVMQPAPFAGTAAARGNDQLRASGPVRVIDGDTFDYGSMRIRIADVDAPEVHGRCPYETALAVRATRRMSALLAAGPFELSALGFGRDEDRYGRKLRIVTRGGHSLGDVLVAEGLARTWTGRREPWC